MKTAYPSYVTINEAVALLIRLDEPLWKHGVFDILLVLIDDAEQKYNQAEDDSDLKAQKLCIDASKSRYELAETLQEQLQNEHDQRQKWLENSYHG